MSPEQARGEQLDARTDLFSFGAVLYEMATGRPAFEGATSAVIFHRILAEAPEPPHQVNPSLPPKLAEIINKAMEKDRELRYHSTGDLRADLKRLKGDTDSGRSSVGAGPLTPSPSPQGREEPKSLEVLPSPSGRGWSQGAGPGEGARRWWPWLAGSLSVIVAGLAVAWFLMRRPPQPSGELTQKRLTFNSGENPIDNAAISHDGKYLAYSDLAGIHVKLLSTGEERLIPKPAGVPAGAQWFNQYWFPDGTQLIANASEPGGYGSIWTVSMLGQSPRELREGLAFAGEVSPDGTRIAFTPRAGTSGDVREIWVMGAQGDNPQKVLAVGENEVFNGVRWSPYGQRLAYIRVRRTADWYQRADSLTRCKPKRGSTRWGAWPLQRNKRSSRFPGANALGAAARCPLDCRRFYPPAVGAPAAPNWPGRLVRLVACNEFSAPGHTGADAGLRA
jgi:hypothetical protein